MLWKTVCQLNINTLIRPLLKKQGLCPDTLANYRPISYLPFISKVIELVEASRLQDHIQSVMGYVSRQHPYRPFHSCETAVTEVLNSVFTAADDRKVTLLVLLDLSSAFDTVDHEILSGKLISLRVTSQVNSWLSL